MKKLIFSVLSVFPLPQADVFGNTWALVIKPSNQLLNKDGSQANAVKVNDIQFQRIVTRCIGMYNPIGFKHIVAVCNGAAKLSITSTQCMAGDTFVKSNCETGTYTKNWIKNTNHEVELGIIGSMKLAELSLSASFQHAAESFTQVTSVKKVVAVVNEVANENIGESHSEDTKTDDTPTV